MTSLSTYLNFNGNCEEAFNFYKSVFNTEFKFFGRFDQMPESPKYKISEKDKKKIMHVSITIGENSVLMGSDSLGDWSPKGSEWKLGNNFSISINIQSKSEADRLFSELSRGGKETMPLSETFWNTYHGSIIDQFGINWMINCAL